MQKNFSMLPRSCGTHRNRITEANVLDSASNVSGIRRISYAFQLNRAWTSDKLNLHRSGTVFHSSRQLMVRLTNVPVFLSIVLWLSGALFHARCTAQGNQPETVREIRAEALRPNRGPEGRPLPLAAHWHASNWPLANQVKLIRQGHHILPFIEWPRHGKKEIDGLEQVAGWNLPLTVINGLQWVMRFYRSDSYENLPVEKTGNAIDTDGNRMNKISPFSPVKPWRTLGEQWTKHAGMRHLQEVYPDPPLVHLVSNNEPNALEWEEVESSGRYMKRFGAGKSDEFKRRVVAEGWKERYGALFDGLRSGLTKPSWKENSKILGYGAFGPDHMGRWGGWKAYSLATSQRVTPNFSIWDGGMGSYYDNDWEGKKTRFNVWSCQVEFMNHVPMKERAFEVDPDFWYEMICWDGGKSKAKQYREKGFEPTSPAHYRGWVQFGMWMLTPRVVREWEGHTAPRKGKNGYWPNMKEIIKAVDVVYRDSVLKRFWRHGKLVANTAHDHPFDTDLPDYYRNTHRWFLLDTSLDPDRPWEYTTHLPVFSLARVIRASDHREWLVYAHAPMGEKSNVRVRVPEYRRITVDVPVEGRFFHVDERDGSVREVGKIE